MPDNHPKKTDIYSDELVGLRGRSQVPAPPKFSWVAFTVMVISIGVALFVGYLIPGPFDEFIITVIISAVYGFLNAHQFDIKSIFKKRS